MLRAKKTSPPGKNDAWLISYGDMVTTLLCFFIVLSALAQDQTGINLYIGTGSFNSALKSFGVPGMWPDDAKPIEFKDPAPHYLGDPEDRNSTAADQTRRTIDWEEEKLQRFLQELVGEFPVKTLPRIEKQAFVDIYERLNRSSPYLTNAHMEAISQIIPLLRQRDYQVYIVVWATTPRETAWLRAARLADTLVEEVSRTVRLESGMQQRVVPLGQPWRYRDIERPVFSLIITRAKTSS